MSTNPSPEKSPSSSSSSLASAPSSSRSTTSKTLKESQSYDLKFQQSEVGQYSHQFPKDFSVVLKYHFDDDTWTESIGESAIPVTVSIDGDRIPFDAVFKDVYSLSNWLKHKWPSCFGDSKEKEKVLLLMMGRTGAGKSTTVTEIREALYRRTVELDSRATELDIPRVIPDRLNELQPQINIQMVDDNEVSGGDDEVSDASVDRQNCLSPSNRDDEDARSTGSVESVSDGVHALVQAAYPNDPDLTDFEMRMKKLVSIAKNFAMELIEMRPSHVSGIWQYEFITTNGSDSKELNSMILWHNIILSKINESGDVSEAKVYCKFCYENFDSIAQIKAHTRVHIWAHWGGVIRCCVMNGLEQCNTVCRSYTNMCRHVRDCHPHLNFAQKSSRKKN